MLDGKKQDESIHKMLTEMFAEYTRYLAANKEHIEMTKNRSRSRGRTAVKTQEPYIMLKMNVVQDLIAQSTNSALLKRWDQLILKLQKT